MVLYGLLGDVELIGNLLIGESLCDAIQYFDLAR